MTDRDISIEEAREILEPVVNEHFKYGLNMTMQPSRQDVELLVKYAKQVAAYQEYWITEIYPHDNDDEDYSWEETDFNGFTEGWLIASGVPTLDAMFLSSFLRYNLQYFEIEYNSLKEAKPDDNF